MKGRNDRNDPKMKKIKKWRSGGKSKEGARKGGGTGGDNQLREEIKKSQNGVHRKGQKHARKKLSRSKKTGRPVSAIKLKVHDWPY